MSLLFSQLYGLELTKFKNRDKYMLTGIFSLSLIIVIVAIVRVVKIRATTRHVDPIWLALWSTVEASVGQSPSPITYPRRKTKKIANTLQPSLSHASPPSVSSTSATATIEHPSRANLSDPPTFPMAQ